MLEKLNYNKQLLPVHQTSDKCPKKDAIEVNCHQFGVCIIFDAELHRKAVEQDDMTHKDNNGVHAQSDKWSADQ
jgi:hypothetical protein